MDDIDFDALAEDARRLGYVSADLVINRLARMVKANIDYVERRQKRGYTSRYNETVAEDSVVLALAMQILKEAEKP